MGYILNSSADCWQDGVICLPRSVCEKHLKFADENKLKALLLLVSQGGACDKNDIAKLLSLDADEAAECLDFWVGEGILKNAEDTAAQAEASAQADKKAYEVLPVPNLTPKDIVRICSENEEIRGLLITAETILMSTLSNSMKSNLVNMVNYYGLPASVVVTLLNYYKSERDAGKNITTRNLNLMAKQWADDGVKTLDEASKKLQELSSCEELWSEVITLCGFDYRKPTSAQIKMLARWRDDFDKEMIFFSCNTMKKYTEEDKQSLKIVDNILKDWKRKGFKTPADVKAQPKKEDRKGDKLKRKPSFDIDEIKKKAELNDDFDI